MTPEDKVTIGCDIIDEFISLCEANEIVPSLKELKKAIPTVLLYLYGPLYSIILDQINVKTYSDFYKLVEKQIKLNPDYDFVEDINLDNSIIEDISKIDYQELLIHTFSLND